MRPNILFCSKGIRGWAGVLLLAGGIMLASGRGQLAGPEVVNFDKFAHFSVFGLLATLVARNGFVPRLGWLAVAITSVFGLMDEWRQSLTPGRFPSLFDWYADTLGAAVAVALYTWWPWYRNLLEAPLRRRRKAQVEKAPELVPNAVADDAR